MHCAAERMPTSVSTLLSPAILPFHTLFVYLRVLQACTCHTQHLYKQLSMQQKEETQDRHTGGNTAARPMMDSPTTTLWLKGGTVVDSEQGTMYPADVLVRHGQIVDVAPALCPPDGEYTVIDCTGQVVTAGFVDAHVHIESSMVLPKAFGRAVLPFGTTTVIADPHEVVNVAGAEGLRVFLDETDKADISIFTVIPSCVPATPYDTNGAGLFTAEQMRPFADDPRVVGLGEVMSFCDVASGNPMMMEKLALFAGRPIDGHTAGMDDALLDAYVSQGISNDHECYDEQGLLMRYHKGMCIYIREGSAARNAHELLDCIRRHHLDVSRFAFCTDDKHLATIAAEGHISHIVGMALHMGFDWGEVARMASYNPCQYYHLPNRGNIRVGYVADIVVTDPLCNTISHVIKDGIPAGQLTQAEPQQHSLHAAAGTGTVRFRELRADDFEPHGTDMRVGIGLVREQLLTTRVELAEGAWKGLNRLATVERHGKNGNIALCPLVGYGIQHGAVATSVSHDSHNVICAGDNAADMAVACNRLRQLGGGYVIASGGRVVDEFALPCFGLMSDQSAAASMRAIARLESQAHAMHVNSGIDPFTTLSFLALPVIPEIRLLDTGLFDVVQGHFIPPHEA